MIRNIAFGIWVFIIIGSLGSYFLWPELFTPESIIGLLSRFQSEAIFFYVFLSVLRGFSLLPSTPLVLAGTMMFPSQPWLVLGVSIFGILISSSMIYWFADILGVTEFFEKRKAEHVAKIRARLEHPAGSLFVALWAFFPFVPTDAVCYVAGVTRMHFVKFIAAIFVGELLLCGFYIFGAGQLIQAWFA